VRGLPDHQTLVEGVLAGNRAHLARAITLVESRRPAHRARAAALMDAILPHTGGSIRVGITGVPGVGKSSFIEAMGLKLIEQGKRLAVLAIDPSSTRTGGSILGDKTRMVALSRDTRAFIRPSPTAGTLGGVAANTREAMLLCEAAGFDVVFVETVGVGQSEHLVVQMTDHFLLLMLAGAGDELQGIKRGVMELADVLVVHKADGENVDNSRRATGTYRNALRLLRGRESWIPRVLPASSLTGEGLDSVWENLMAHRDALGRSGLEQRRATQRVAWFREQLADALQEQLETRIGSLEAEESAIRDRRSGAASTARRVVESLFSQQKLNK